MAEVDSLINGSKWEQTNWRCVTGTWSSGVQRVQFVSFNAG